MAKPWRKLTLGGLTPKEAKFTQELLKQVKKGERPNGTRAALIAYDTTSKRTASAIATENLDKPPIREALEEAYRTNGLSLNTITHEIGNLSTTKVEKVTADVKLRANIELLKLIGAYPDRKSARLNLNISTRIKSLDFDEAKKELNRLSTDSQSFLKDTE